MKRAYVILIIVIIVAIIVGCSLIRTIFYPPAVEAGELYDNKGQSLSFSKWDKDLQEYVKNGSVNYSKWKENQQNLDDTLAYFKTIRRTQTARDHLLAAYINAYNAFTIKLILEYFPGIKGIRDIPSAKRWDAVRWEVGEKTVSLNQLEHDILRKEFIEPRIHFAIVCASIGCPHLLNRAYEGNILDTQLTEMTQNFFRRKENCKIDGNTVYLSSILDWFRGDFVRDELATKLQWFGEDYKKASQQVRLLMFVCKFAPKDIREKISKNYKNWSIKYTTYDWNLNGQ
ncbi:DUF547 domain-containing protein [Candidatus Uabimicrobium amorphum]|uniref:Membrane protein n=1 Tax=Uabimicrobium amorphum TaxID=2596890 RepID=A0A5S9IPB3_UABAM|nr:DUF547 domain-containing protein [Candidatus Uabimicrobium amorphum]BBM84205.1 membrane protein [Candidatus Uabimicrobium amorphum]